MPKSDASDRLAAAEARMSEGFDRYLAVHEINRDRLYRAEFDTFDAYVEARL